MILLGMVLDAVAVLLIVTPIVLPVLAPLGIDRLHFGILLIVNMEIAFLTPPIGLNLFVLSSIAKAPLGETIRGVAPFVLLLLGFLLVVAVFPADFALAAGLRISLRGYGTISSAGRVTGCDWSPESAETQEDPHAVYARPAA